MHRGTHDRIGNQFDGFRIDDGYPSETKSLDGVGADLCVRTVRAGELDRFRAIDAADIENGKLLATLPRDVRPDQRLGRTKSAGEPLRIESEEPAGNDVAEGRRDVSGDVGAVHVGQEQMNLAGGVKVVPQRIEVRPGQRSELLPFRGQQYRS